MKALPAKPGIDLIVNLSGFRMITRDCCNLGALT
jgi:hypothetical protein